MEFFIGSVKHALQRVALSGDSLLYRIEARLHVGVSKIGMPGRGLTLDALP